MLDGNRLDFDTIDYQTLTPEEWTLFREGLIRMAQRERSQALGTIIKRSWAGIGMFANTLAALLARGLRAYAAWHATRNDIAALNALDDGTLKDIGLRRSEIESIVRKPHDPTRHAHLKKAA